MTVADPLLEAMLSRMAGPPPVVPDVSTQFANPYHDELGRFARKGEGRRVPTKGVEDSATIPDKTSLSGQPELKEAFTRAIYEGSKIGGNTPSAHTDQFQDILPTGFDVDGEEYDVAWSLWSRDADYPQLVFHGTITDADGRWAGDTMRAFARDLQEDSEIYAYHDRLSIRQGVQGQGIGTSFLAACEAAYVKAGINEIRLHANLDVGGYAWARAGFDFETADQAAITVDDMLTYTDPDYTVNADGLPDEYQETLTDIRRRIVTEGVVPTPYELSRIGYDQRRIRRDGSETWWAKEVMMDLEWDAKKILTPAVPVAVAAAAGMSRVEFLQALGALHLRHSLAHATDAPPAPDRKDGSLWNLDYWAPDEFEAEFQAAAAQLLAAYRGPETFATMKARLYAQFANPYHDERGRFAPKNTGRRVPTKGTARGELVDQTGEGQDFLYVTDRGSTPVYVTNEFGGDWDVDRDREFMIDILDASQSIDPDVGIQFGQDPEIDKESFAFVSSANRRRIVFPSRYMAFDGDDWRQIVDEAPEMFMPAAQTATFAEYITAHEHGHIAHFALIPKTGRYLDEPEFMRLHVDPVNRLFDLALNSTEGQEEGLAAALGLSTYGVSSPFEAVAEAYAQHHLDPDNLSDEARQILVEAGVLDGT